MLSSSGCAMSSQPDEFSLVWSRIRAHEGGTFRTRTGLAFRYEIASEGTMWIIRDGKLINSQLATSQIRKAHGRGPLTGPGEISHSIRNPSYVFGILSDSRIHAWGP